MYLRNWNPGLDTKWTEEYATLGKRLVHGCTCDGYRIAK